MKPIHEEIFFDDEVKYRELFMREGFLHLKSVFSADDCQNAITTIREFENNIDNSNSVEFVTETINDTVLTKYFQGAYKLGDPLRKFFSSKLLSIGVSLLQEDAYFADLEAHIRNPGGGEIPRHQDNFYFNLKGARGMTCYIALSEHNEDSGGLNYIRRSHEKVLDHDQSLCPGFSSSLNKDTIRENLINEPAIYSPNYAVGDVSIHHPNNIHFSRSSGPNAIRGFALSARIFAVNEERDPVGLARYKRLLEKNRSIYG